MKWKLGALLVVGVLLVSMVPAGWTYIKGDGVQTTVTPSTGIVTGMKPEPQAPQHQMTLQIDNTNALIQSEITPIVDGLGMAIAPFIDESGNTMLPMRFLAEAFGAEVGYDDTKRATTMTVGEAPEEGEVSTQIVAELKQNDPIMMVNGTQHTLSAAPVNVNGTFYVPVRAVSEAFDWQVQFVPKESGAFVFVGDGEEAFSDEDVVYLRTEGAEKLGLSTTQHVNDSLILRAGAEDMLGNGQLLDLPEGQGLIYQEGSGYYLPTEIMAQISGGILSADGFGNLMQDSKVISTDTIEQEGLYYHNITAFATALSQNYMELGNGIIMLTKNELAQDDNRCAAIVSIVMERLPAITETIPVADHYVALTFDDGPTSGLTPKLLDGLLERGAHATFFMCGYRIEDFNSFGSRYLAEGHELGNHTMDHENLTNLTTSGQKQQMNDTTALIEQYMGGAPTLMRPTGGAYNDNVKATMRELGYPVIMWSLDTQDWKTRNEDAVYKEIVNNVQDGDIILMHDLYSTTVDAVFRAMDALTLQGYAFVTVSELAEIRGIELQPGEVYNNLRAAA